MKMINNWMTDMSGEDIPKIATKEEVKPKIDYTNLVEEKELEISKGISLVFSASSTGEFSPVHVDIRTWVKSENYTGPTKKGINFDVEYLEEFIEILQGVSSELKKKNK